MNLVTSQLSEVTGLPEPTIRLLLTIVFGYPTAYIYHKFYAHSSREKRNQYVLFSGVVLNLFFNGFQIYHSVITIAVSYAFCYAFSEQRTLATAGVWIFNAAYLLIGYYVMETDEYDITWTMTQCILCLRMMGFGFDYYDGKYPSKPGTALPLSFKEDTPLAQLPPLISVTAYALYPAAFVVGPQFSFSLYSKWLDYPPISKHKEQQRARDAHIMRSVFLATAYLGIQQAVGNQYSTSYLLTDDYLSLPFIKRAFFFCIAGKFAFSKYIGIWLLTEGAITAFGISYEGLDKQGLEQFRGLANALPYEFETATSLDQVIGAFNINTNLWSKYYVFKRLKFLGSKLASQFGTLAFLAIWHGFHSVYFSTFSLEFFFVLCQSVLRKRIIPHLEIKNGVCLGLWRVLSWVTCQATIAYGIAGFELLTFDKAWIAYKSVGFLGHWAILIILIGNKVFREEKKTKQQ